MPRHELPEFIEEAPQTNRNEAPLTDRAVRAEKKRAKTMKGTYNPNDTSSGSIQVSRKHSRLPGTIRVPKRGYRTLGEVQGTMTDILEAVAQGELPHNQGKAMSDILMKTSEVLLARGHTGDPRVEAPEWAGTEKVTPVGSPVLRTTKTEERDDPERGLATSRTVIDMEQVAPTLTLSSKKAPVLLGQTESGD